MSWGGFLICFFSPPSFCESPLSLLLFKLTETSMHSVSLLFLSFSLPWLFFVVAAAADDDSGSCFAGYCFVVFPVADDAA